MAGKPVTAKGLRPTESPGREGGNGLPGCREELRPYQLLRAGDPGAAGEAARMFSLGLSARLSDDPLRSSQYLFAACTVPAVRAAIAGGVEAERARSIGRRYMREMDRLGNVDAVGALFAEMFALYAAETAAQNQKALYSRPVALCLDYIRGHLGETLRLKRLAKYADLNASYLSTLFKKETGVSVSEYILSKRMEAAQNMLKFSSDSYAEISAALAFSSQSHFTRVFKQQTGYTPKAYRDAFFRLP